MKAMRQTRMIKSFFMDVLLSLVGEGGESALCANPRLEDERRFMH